jgi:hypothetical protein
LNAASPFRNFRPEAFSFRSEAFSFRSELIFFRFSRQPLPFGFREALASY